MLARGLLARRDSAAGEVPVTMGMGPPWFADPMRACRRLAAHQRWQRNLPLDLHPDRAAHLQTSRRWFVLAEE